MHRYFVNTSLTQDSLELTGAEAHHLSVVCRLRVGDTVMLFNGDGREYLAKIASLHKKQVSLDIQSSSSPERELGYNVIVAAPLPKGDRGQFLIEKLTELGVTSYIPLRTVRSVIDPSENRLEKLERYVIEASKQCGRNRLMSIQESTDWKNLCHWEDLPKQRYIGHPGGQRLSVSTGRDVIFVIGPEGGFTPEEVAYGEQGNWQRIDLGQRILRIETAALLLAGTQSYQNP